MGSARPTFAEHLTLMEHDRQHGSRAPRLGARAQWIRMWWVQRFRQWTGSDAIVCGSNPVLGALACARLAGSGLSVTWILESGPDAWDYPLTVAGQHDDLTREARLPPMGPGLFAELAKRCGGRALFAPGWSVDYSFEGRGGPRICFASREDSQESAAWGEARSLAESWAREAFGSLGAHRALSRPERKGGGPRQQLFAAPFVAWTSDRPDGRPRQHRGFSTDPGQPAPGSEARMGRALWHAQEPVEFAARSRDDVRLALALDLAQVAR